MSADKDIFLSYGREPLVTEFVKKLKVDLVAGGFGVWLDTDEIPSGSDWNEAIGIGILYQCRALLAVVTPKYVTSRNCTSELYLANSAKKEIFPIFYADTNLSAGVELVINGINWTMFRPKEDSYEASLKKLKDGLRKHATAPAEAPPAASAPGSKLPDEVDGALASAVVGGDSSGTPTSGAMSLPGNGRATPTGTLPAGTSSGTIDAPNPSWLCNCGILARRLQVKKEGRDQGRWFHMCATNKCKFWWFEDEYLRSLCTPSGSPQLRAPSTSSSPSLSSGSGSVNASRPGPKQYREETDGGGGDGVSTGSSGMATRASGSKQVNPATAHSEPTAGAKKPAAGDSAIQTPSMDGGTNSWGQYFDSCPRCPSGELRLGKDDQGTRYKIECGSCDASITFHEDVTNVSRAARQCKCHKIKVELRFNHGKSPEGMQQGYKGCINGNCDPLMQKNRWTINQTVGGGSSGTPTGGAMSLTGNGIATPTGTLPAGTITPQRKPSACSVCGKTGHNRRTCPLASHTV